MKMNEGFKLTQAIQELVPKGTNWTVRGPNIDTDVWIEDENLRPSKTAIQAKLAELQADYDSKQYQRDRASQYPSIQDQLDMQYHDQVDGTTTWKDSIAKVKSDNPKPT